MAVAIIASNLQLPYEQLCSAEFIQDSVASVLVSLVRDEIQPKLVQQSYVCE